ncbi:MAG TPA: chemotaxis protein CheW [Longimicrobiaceae bacterium]|nr:chemotaxis protein CheW [Longimicrobiaceae bacterium]
MRKARQAAVPQVQLVTFRLGPEEFGLDVFAVHEILRYQEPTPVPRAPEFVEGVIDVRGTLVPVVDLRRRFELADAPVNDETRTVLVEHAGERLGLVVDAVSEVLRVPETAVSAPPAYIRGLAAEFVRGIVRLEGGRLIILIDVERILSSQERIALEGAELVPGADPSPDTSPAEGA